MPSLIFLIKVLHPIPHFIRRYRFSTDEETAFQAALRIADASVLSKFLAKGALKASPADLEAALFYCAKANHCNGLKIWLEAVKASGKPPSSSSSKLGSGSGEWNALNLNCKVPMLH